MKVAPTLQDSVVRGVFWTSMDSWGRQVLAFVIYAALARLVGPESFGIVALGLVYVAFVEIFVTQGFGTSLVQRKNLEDGHLDSAFWICMTMATALALATVLLAERVAAIFGEPRLAGVLRWMSVSLILMGLSAVPQAALTRAMAFRALAARSVLATLTAGIVGLTLAWHGFGVWSLVVQQLTSAATATVVLWWATAWRPSFPPSWRHVRDLYGFALSIAGNNILWFGTQRADQTLIGYGFGAAALGPYALASRCIQLLMDAVAVPMQVVALPAFSRIQDERNRLLNAFYRMTEVVAVIAVPAFSGLAVLAPSLVPVIFGPSWSAAVPLLQALAVFGLLRVPTSFGHPLILAIGRPGIYFSLFVLQTVLTVALCLLATRWSPLAVAAAVSLSMAMNSAVQLAVWRRLAGVSIRMLGSRLWAPALASAVMSAAVLAFQHLVRERLGDLLTAVGGVVLGASVYSIGMVVLQPELVRQLARILLSRARSSRAASDLQPTHVAGGSGVNAVVPRLLLAIEKSYTRFTSFSRGRFACSRMIFWGVRHLGFKVPLLRLTSGIVIEYSPSVARDAVMRDLLLTGSFEPEQSALIEALLPKGGVFLDVGANIGYFTVLGGRSVGPTGRVYAFEPVEEIHRLLSTNVSLNGLENVEALALACFSSPGQMGMERASDSGKSHLSPARAHSKPVSLTTVDDFVALARIDRVDLIKIDTEGSDLEVLKGARRTVDRFRPAVILELDHLSRFGGSQSEILEFFRRCDYEVLELRGKHSLDLLAKPRG